MNEGVIKFNITENILTLPIETNLYEDIENLRVDLYKLKLIGMYEESGIGYGNISKKIGEEFLITGSQTGHLENLNGNHYCMITGYDFADNSVKCSGPLNPSSESLTHAAFYYYNDKIKYVVHVHCEKLWNYMITNDYLSTSKEAEYGSRKLYEEISALVKNKLITNQSIVMIGHQDGVIFTGDDLNHIKNEIINLYNKVNLI